MSKMKKSLLIVLSFALLGLIMGIAFYNKDIPMIVSLIIGLLAGLTFIVMLFKKGWRKQYLYLPLSVGIGCVIFFFLIMPDFYHFTKDETKEALKVANKIAKERGVKIIDIQKDECNSYALNEYSKTYIAYAKKDNVVNHQFVPAFDMENDSAVLFIRVHGQWNEETELVDSKNLEKLSLTDNQLMILKKGQLKMTDNKIKDADYDGYFEFLRNTLASFSALLSAEEKEIRKDGLEITDLIIGVQKDYDGVIVQYYNGDICVLTLEFYDDDWVEETLLSTVSDIFWENAVCSYKDFLRVKNKYVILESSVNDTLKLTEEQKELFEESYEVVRLQHKILELAEETEKQ